MKRLFRFSNGSSSWIGRRVIARIRRGGRRGHSPRTHLTTLTSQKSWVDHATYTNLTSSRKSTWSKTAIPMQTCISTQSTKRRTLSDPIAKLTTSSSPKRGISRIRISWPSAKSSRIACRVPDPNAPRTWSIPPRWTQLCQIERAIFQASPPTPSKTTPETQQFQKAKEVLELNTETKSQADTATRSSYRPLRRWPPRCQEKESSTKA